MWLLRLSGWLGNDKTPDELESVFSDHYAMPSTDHYHTIGRYLLGKISESDLLDTIKTDKQRCEIAYYIGLNYRLKGQFAQAADWYRICCETDLYNNGECFWAFTELYWWSLLGSTQRSRFLPEEIQRHQEQSHSRNEKFHSLSLLMNAGQ